MKYMNDYDLTRAVRRFEHTPRRRALALVVSHLAEQTNDVSDGWAYWPKPLRAAAKAIVLIESTTNAANERQEAEDITVAEFRKAMRPIKSFLTRHAHVYNSVRREVILWPSLNI